MVGHEIVTGRDGGWCVRCAVGEGKGWSAPRSIFLYLDSLWAIELYDRFRVLRVVALRVVASSREEYAASLMS